MRSLFSILSRKFALALELPPCQVDYGSLQSHLELLKDPAELLVARYSDLIKREPENAEHYHHRAHAYLGQRQAKEAIEDLDRAIAIDGRNAHYRSLRGAVFRDLRRYEQAIANFEMALSLEPENRAIRKQLALCCNNLAWDWATGEGGWRYAERLLATAERAVSLMPYESTYLNTLGVAQYRAGRYQAAIARLERSLEFSRGQTDGFDLFFLATAHHLAGQDEAARRSFDRAVRWVSDQKTLPSAWVNELTKFQAEARACLAWPVVGLPHDVFGPDERAESAKISGRR